MTPSLDYEHRLAAEGAEPIAGIDEAGRGCWAGPVVAAAVILKPDVYERPELLDGINDSKMLTANQRDAAYARVQACALGIGVGIIPSYLIDGFGIVPATKMAMSSAVFSLPCLPKALLIDAVKLKELPFRQESIIRGDSTSLSIAAASIIAKVTRDRLMHTASQVFPNYGFEQHKGYGTAQHQAALSRFGPCQIHRFTFQPVANLNS
jgi:ribonuclease HII